MRRNLVITVKKIWEEEPFKVILVLAIVFRLIAVIFAKGWGMLDDHFLVIETAQSWVDGYDSDNWLPGSPENTGPTGHSFFYPGVHFLLFTIFKLIHLNDPQLKMTLVRLLHAAWSMITVYYGYKLTLRLGGEKSAKVAGLILAILWFFPWASVRNMVEVVTIPLLMLAVWVLYKKDDHNRKWIDFLVAGLFLGLAFNIRIQTAWFSIGLGVALLLQGRWKQVIVLTLGALLPLVVIQGTIDLFLWGRPFAEIMGYVKGNIIDATSYINLPWYHYFIVVLGLLIPPISVFLFWGFLKEWKRYSLIFIPVAIFFVFHSIFPNKQERFIFPILPFIIILGSIGWAEHEAKMNPFSKWKSFFKGSWIFFWIINTIFLVGVSLVYSKKARVETMCYLSKYENIKYLLVADAGNNPELFPKFYLQQWPTRYDKLKKDETTDQMLERISKVPYSKQPRFILFSTEGSLQEEVLKARRWYPYIVYETTIEPGFVDKVVRWLNPINKNRTVYIYRNTLFYPQKIE